MKIGPDGSLPRITSSIKNIVSNLRIVKIPDDQLKKDEPPYKLVCIGDDEDKSELSEKSDEELWSSEEDVSNIQLPVENTKDADSTGNTKIEMNKDMNIVKQNNQSERRHNDNRHKRNKRNKCKSYNRNFNTYRKPYNSYNSGFPSYNNNKRNFGSPDNFRSQSVIPNKNSSDIDPWINSSSSLALNSGISFDYSHYLCGPVMNPILQTPPNPVAENSMKPGLLEIPPHLHPQIFPITRINEHQEYHSSNYQRHNFHTQTQADCGNYYQNNEYHSSGYQRSNQYVQMPSDRNNFYGRKTPSKSRKGKQNWSKNMRNTSRNCNFRN